MSKPLISVRGLTKVFGDFTAVAGIDFDVAKGESFGILGPNGAGKSTLMKIVSGQIKADAGTVTLFGQTLEQGDPMVSRRSGVSIVPQELSPYPDLSIYENLFISLCPLLIHLHKTLHLLFWFYF